MFAKKSNSRIFSFLLALALTFSAAGSMPARAAGIRYAAPGGAGDCSSWASACTLQTALTNAISGDEIWVAAGAHKPTTLGTDRAATFQLKSGVAVYGGFAGTETARDQRNPAVNVAILSGDIDNNDSQTPIITNLATVTGNSANSYHVVTGATGATLDGFTITAGNANGASDPIWNGGGMYNKISSPTLTNITFSGNSALNYGGGMFNDDSKPKLTNVAFSGNSVTDSGGGMYNTYSDPILTSVAFSGNTADSGGGMFNSYSDPILTNVTFSGNSAIYGGGGMHNWGSAPTIIDSVFSGNTAYYNGGGIYIRYYSHPKLTNVTIENNSATYTAGNGGGIYSWESNLTLTNVTFSGNWALNNGGGLHAMMDGNGSPILTNITFTGNTAYNNGGGIYVDYAHLTLTNLTFKDNTAVMGGGMYARDNSQIRNAIFWGNTAPVAGAQIYYKAGPLALNDSVVQDGCPAGITCANIISTDPALGALGNYGGFTQTIPLQMGSSAIDTGNDSTCAAADQRGIPRPQGAHCDIGAYEYIDASVPTATANAASAITAAGATLNGTVNANGNSAAVTFEYGLTPAYGAAVAANQSPVTGSTDTAVSKTIAGLSSNTTYHFRVTAQNIVGAVSSSDLTFTTAAIIDHAKNGDFETYIGASKIPQSWKAVNFKTANGDGKDTSTHKVGKASLKITGAGIIKKTLTQNLNTLSGAAGDVFTLSFYVKGSGLPKTGICQIDVFLYDGSTQAGKITKKCPAVANFNWNNKLTSKLTAAQPYTRVVIRITVMKASGVVWFDGVSLMR
jgi:predicted outer membrane repeat protein/parallel beta-helix repeat protein